MSVNIWLAVNIWLSINQMTASAGAGAIN